MSLSISEIQELILFHIPENVFPQVKQLTCQQDILTIWKVEQSFMSLKTSCQTFGEHAMLDQTSKQL